MGLLAIVIVGFVVVLLIAVALQLIGSRMPKSDPEEAEAIAAAQADQRREAANRPTGGTGTW